MFFPKVDLEEEEPGSGLPLFPFTLWPILSRPITHGKDLFCLGSASMEASRVFPHLSRTAVLSVPLSCALAAGWIDLPTL